MNCGIVPWLVLATYLWPLLWKRCSAFEQFLYFQPMDIWFRKKKEQMQLGMWWQNTWEPKQGSASLLGPSSKSPWVIKEILKRLRAWTLIWQWKNVRPLSSQEPPPLIQEPKLRHCSGKHPFFEYGGIPSSGETQGRPQTYLIYPKRLFVQNSLHWAVLSIKKNIRQLTTSKALKTHIHTLIF